jgi:hypothetical protein
MPITDADEARVVALLAHDVAATIDARRDVVHVIRATASDSRRFADTYDR